MADPKLIAKIKALLAKTLANGATEAEALAAAMKARELMDRERLELSDLEAEAMGQFRCELHGPNGPGKFDVRQILMPAICLFTNTRGVAMGGTRDAILFGAVADVVFAEWLLDTLEGFCNRRALGYLFNRPLLDRKKRGYLSNDDRRAMTDFADSCAVGIRERLLEEVRKRRAEDPEGFARKERNAFAETARAGIQRSGTSASRSVRVPTSAEGQAGYRAAADARFNVPVAGDRQAREPLLLT